ncbi:GNAT family N-acetyltransferase [Leifsonia xyli]|uniref:GNAT family N-acetyltransferase n=1 Tax=Leifsonia xyli TaxID=1575 RepID=UPI003D66A2D3
MAGWVVRASTEDDWQAYRALRFEMLEDAPIAFLETLEQARRHPDEHWRRRASNSSGTTRLFAAVAEDGRWLGSMGGFQAAGAPEPFLVGVYVSPAWRGREHGMTDALLDAVVGWARGRGDRLLLEVHEHNEPAIRSYLRRGFVFTGRTQPYPLDRTANEREMALPLSPVSAPASAPAKSS